LGKDLFPIARNCGAVTVAPDPALSFLHGVDMQIEGMAELAPPLIDADPAKLPPMAA
jgi:hypothetical protein